MCGIAGILEFSGRAVTAADIRAMTDLLIHRGPDGGDHWISPDQSVAFGHRRLAIIDTTQGGRQPMMSHDGRYVITYNGEIYNFLELREELLRSGFIFKSDSDTEVILAAFCQWGESMLTRFNGMWAFAIYDTLQRRLFVARDRFGVKPLLYCWTPKFFAFASELQALRRTVVSSGKFDLEVAGRLVVDGMRVEGSSYTLFTDIHRLQGGYCGWISESGIKLRRWWRTVDHLVDVPATSKQRVDHFRELFFDSIRLRMRSDVPVGTCLSGGFDSTAVTCSMAQVAGSESQRMSRSWRHAFIASFPGWEFDERSQAEEAAKFAGIVPNIMSINHETGVSELEKILTDIGDVNIDPGIGPWLIYRSVSQAGIKVTLDGHGADEMMGAYKQEGYSLKFGLQTVAANLMSRSEGIRYLHDRTRQLILSGQDNNFLRNRLGRPFSLVGQNDLLPTDWGGTSRGLYTMFHSTVLPTLLRNFDRASMAHGVEVRMPFMDWRLVCFVMSLPNESKFANGYTKWVARDAMAGIMPETIRMNRKKLGFNSPLTQYLPGPLKQWVHDLLEKPSPAFDEIIDRRRLVKTIEKLNAGSGWTFTNSQRIWPYLNLKYLIESWQ